MAASRRVRAAAAPRGWLSDASLGRVSGKSSHDGVSRWSHAAEFSYGHRVELGYARESTAKQNLERQIDALTGVGIASEATGDYVPGVSDLDLVALVGGRVNQSR